MFLPSSLSQIVCSQSSVPSRLFPVSFSLFLIPRSSFCFLFHVSPNSLVPVPYSLSPVPCFFHFRIFLVPYSMFHVLSSFLFFVLYSCSLFLETCFCSLFCFLCCYYLFTVLVPMSLFHFLSNSLFPVLCSPFYGDCFSFNSITPCPVPALVRRF
jgi:hypothetical protein